MDLVNDAETLLQCIESRDSFLVLGDVTRYNLCTILFNHI